jgi:diacylglycerol O-acyltransferase
MERLSGQDAYFLYRETPTAHMHTLKLAVCDAPAGRPFDQIVKNVEKYLHLLPVLRHRVVPVPLGFHHPVWIEDPDFDVSHHVRRVGLPAPGGSRELDEVVSEIASHQLDRSRPLWELWMIDGLAGGRIAYLLKLHHAFADGSATAELILNSAARVRDEEPPPVEAPYVAEAYPSRWRLLVDAMRDHIRQLVRLPGLLLRSLRNVRALMTHQQSAEIVTPSPFESARTPFNRALSARRIFVTTSLSLDECKRVKNAFGVTLNDVLLGLAAGAMRRYLKTHGQPDPPALSTSIPVGADAPGSRPRLYGNRVSFLQTRLRCDLEDPVERLRATSAQTGAAKQVLEHLGKNTMRDWMEYLPPLPYTALRRLQARLRLADLMPSPANLVVSNVAGPREHLFWSGTRMDELYSVGPLSEGIGLNITVWSYSGRLSCGLLACRDAAPDLEQVAEGMHDELHELLACADEKADEKANEKADERAEQGPAA